MSEKLPVSHEHLPRPEATPEHEPDHLRHERERKAEQARHHAKESLHHIQKAIEQEAVSGKEVPVGEHHKENRHDHVPPTKELRKLSLSRTLTSVRKELNPADRTLSKIVHRPAVDAVSTAVGKTVARPSGIIGGGLLGLLGTSTLLFISKRYGFEYNYLIAGLLFVGGFFVGLIAEAVIKLFRRHHN